MRFADILPKLPRAANAVGSFAARVHEVRAADMELRVRAPRDWPFAAVEAAALMALEPFGESPAYELLADEAGPLLDIAAIVEAMVERLGEMAWRIGACDSHADRLALEAALGQLFRARALIPGPRLWAGLPASRHCAPGWRVSPFTGSMEWVEGPVLAEAGGAGTRPGEAMPPRAALAALLGALRDSGAVHVRRGRPGDQPAPCLTLNLMAFLDGAGFPDAEALAQAVRLAVVVAEIGVAMGVHGDADLARRHFAIRPVRLTVAGTASLLMSQGLAYDSEAGRGLAAAVLGLVRGAMALASAEMAELMGPAPEAALSMDDSLTGLGAATRHVARRVATLPPSLAAIGGRALESLSAARTGARRWGLRSADAQLRLADGPELGLCDGASGGIEPVSGLVQHVATADGAFARRIAPEAELAGMDGVMARALLGRGTLVGAPGVSAAALSRLGFTDEALARIEAALPGCEDLRGVFTPWVLGRCFCRNVLSMTPEQLDEIGFDILAFLGFSEAEIAAAQLHVIGDPSARPADPALAAALRCGLPDDMGGGIDATARLRLAGAVAPLLDGHLGVVLPLLVEPGEADLISLLETANAAGLDHVTLLDAHAGREPVTHGVALARPLSLSLDFSGRLSA